MKKVLGGFGLIAGATYPFRALAVFLNNSYLWGYILTPILINLFLGIVIYGGLIFLGWQGINDTITYLSQQFDRLIINLPTWLNVLEYVFIPLLFLLRAILIIGLLVATGFILMQFGVILGAPWYGKLSEELEKFRLGQLEVVEVGIVGDVSRAILFELKKLSLILSVGLVLFILDFLPAIGPIIATLGTISIAATIVCLDFLDGALERRRLSFREKLGIIWRNLPATASFGLVCLALISVPLLNLATIPLCVASGTLFFCDRIYPRFSLSTSTKKLD